jgi:GNAT superfamily N-acetyltransferase
MLWRVRTSLADRPGSLARITSSCGENGLNILALQIFPDVGSVVDELVLEAADEWTGQEIASIVAAAGGDTVGVTPCGPRHLVDEPVRWLRAAEQIMADRSQAERVLTGLVGDDDADWSFAENARVAALLDVVRGADHVESEPIRPDVVVYDVYTDAVVARIGATVVATASLEPNGDTTVVVSPAWRRKGIGRALLVMVAGVARHAGRDEILLLAPGDDQGTLPMVASIGLHPMIRLHEGLLQLRIGLRTIRPVAPSSRVSPDTAPPRESPVATE